tara:strand:+ start:3970 stop:4371 length:402 start_codon:yes stop_codon:yes gene_type:complete
MQMQSFRFFRKVTFWARWIQFVAIVHMLVAIVIYHREFLDVLGAGFFGAVTSLSQKVALWFFMIGMTLLILGWCLEEMIRVPKRVAYSVLLVVLLGLCLVPKSGFWLLSPPAIFLCLVAHRNEHDRAVKLSGC